MESTRSTMESTHQPPTRPLGTRHLRMHLWPRERTQLDEMRMGASSSSEEEMGKMGKGRRRV